MASQFLSKEKVFAQGVKRKVTRNYDAVSSLAVGFRTNKTVRRKRIKMHKKEYLLADPAYIGAPHCLVKYKKHKLCSLLHGQLPAGCKCNCPQGRLPMERAFNWTLDGVRGRVEKIIGQVVHHKVRCVAFISTVTLFS